MSGGSEIGVGVRVGVLEEWEIHCFPVIALGWGRHFAFDLGELCEFESDVVGLENTHL